jgi:outer membrane receptor for ferrienterochelin and colicins
MLGLMPWGWAHRAAAEPTTRIEGVVRDEGGRGLDGVTVMLEDLPVGTQTTIAGQFSLANIPAGSHILLLSHVGYRTLRREVVVHAGQVLSLSLRLAAQPVAVSGMVVTGTRTQRRLEDTPIQTTLISRQAIQQQGAARLSEILAEQCGLTLARDHGTGVQLQGFDADYTLILVDGEPVIGRTAGTLELNRFAAGSIEQVEIVKGPLSSLYGSEALAGVVNLITRQPAAPLSLRFGSRLENPRALDLNADLETRRRGLGLLFYLNRRSSPGYDLDPRTLSPTTPRFANYTLQPKLIWTLGPHAALTLSTRFFQERQRSAASAVLGGAEVAMRDRSTVKDWSLAPVLQYRLAPSARLTSRWYSAHYQTDNTLRFDEEDRLYSQSRFSQSFHKVETQLDLVSRAHLLTLGGGLARESVRADRITGGRQTASSLFLYTQEEWQPSRQLDLLASFRLDLHQDYPLHFAPKLAALLRPRPWLGLRLSTGSGFKAPDFRQLYLDFTNPQTGYSVFGSTTVASSFARLQEQGQIQRLLLDSASNRLRPERSRAYSAGTEVTLPGQVSFQLAAFRNDVEDLIETAPIAVKTNDQQVYTYFNLDQVQIQGLEGQARWKIAPCFSLDLGYQYLDAADQRVRAQVRSGRLFKWGEDGRARPVRPGEYGGLFNRSRHSGQVKVAYGRQGLDASLRAVLRGRYGYADLNGNEILDDQGEYAPGYALWNATLGQRLPYGLHLQVGIDNLLDKTHSPSFPFQPGRLLYAGLSKETQP